MKKSTPDQATLTARVIKMDDSLSSFMGYLPNPDEVLRNAGEAISIYREMKIDGRVKSLLTVAKSAVLNYPIRLDASQARAVVVEEVKRCLDDFPLENVVKRLLAAMDYGYAAVELIWKNDAGWWRPDDVVARKPERFTFDQEGRLKHRTRDGTLLDLYSQSYKWLVWRHDKDAENPYGTSILKACYWPWKFKKAGLEFWLMATEKFSVPSILALFESQEGEEKARARAAELAKALGEVSSGSGAALANIKSVEVISVDGKLSEFKALMDWCDTQIAYAIVYQSLAVQEAENGTRAQAQVHADTFLSATKQTCRDIAPVLQQVVDWIVELNFGPGEESPQVQFDLSDYASWAVVKDAIALGVPVSLSTLYDRYGLPRPEKDDDAFVQASAVQAPVAAFADDVKKKAPAAKDRRARILQQELDKARELDSVAAASQTVIVELLRAQILSWMAAVDAAGGPTDENAINTAPPDPTTSLIETSEKLFALSWMLGIDHASPASSLDLADTPDALSFKEAVAFMKSRVPVTKDEWNDLEPKLRFRAFTVAALSSHDSIEQVRRMVTTAIEEGKGVGQFWTETRALDAAWLSGDSPKYWEIVYRTNVQTAYNAGRATEFAREQPEYLEFLGIEDDRQTSICRSRTGTILPATHPYWKSNWPPLHFRCRSTVRGVYPEEVDQIRNENPEWKPDDADALRQDPTSEGFGGNPIDEGSFYKMTQGMAERAREYGLMDDIEAFASSLGIEHRDIEILGKRERPPKQTKAASKPRKKSVVVPTVEISFQAIQDAKLRAVAEKAFKNAPDEVRSVVANHSYDFSYRLAPPRGQSYYSPATETVVLRRSAGPDVFAHEFGHGIDFKVLSHYSRSDEFVSAFNEDLGALMDTKTGELLEMGKKLKQDLVAKGWNDLPPVSDLFSGLTSGRIEGRWGHPMRYWNMEGKREAEVFADLFALKASGETALWSELTGYVPRLCKAVENALTRR